MADLILTNDFHNTEVSLRTKNGILSHSQVEKSEKALCGIPDCTCGRIAGIRGVQFHQGCRIALSELGDGSAAVYYVDNGEEV